MSSILDALKKVEEGKRLRKRGASDLSSMLVPADPQSTRGRGRVRMLAVVLLSAAAGGAVVWFLAGTKPVSAPVQTLPSAPQPVVSASPTTLPDRKSSPLQGGGTQSRPTPLLQPSKQSPRASVPPSKPLLPSPEARPPDTTAPNEERKVIASPPSTPLPRGETGKFRVSGIGWQKDASSRYAVINGNAVSEGGVIDGAKVLEIHQDRVLMERDGQPMEVYLK
ncbi:MAG: hypothetical protein Fur0034_04310 [Desulfuromonadia bacterium]